jgi:hypothetical protein
MLLRARIKFFYLPFSKKCVARSYTHPLMSSVPVMCFSEKDELNMEHNTQKGLNRVEIEVLIIAFVILASGLSFLILNYGLLG